MPRALPEPVLSPAQMMDLETVLAIIDEDQGVCPQGHPCRRDGGSRSMVRVCNTNHVGLAYAGWPLIRLDATPEQIAAVELIDPDLAAWARSTLADQESPID